MNQGTRIIVTVQLWEQLDEGVKTADAGYSLHPHEEDRKNFIEEYWKSLPDEPPRNFCQPVKGVVYRAFVDVSIYDEVRKELYGKRYEGEPPKDITT